MSEPKVIKQFDFAQYTDDGGFEIFGNDTGYPRMKAVIPAPDINTPDAEERIRRHQEGVDGIVLQGYLVTKRQLIRNQAFDRKDQKTTLSLAFRPCMSKQEIEVVALQIKEILKRKVSEEHRLDLLKEARKNGD